LGSKITIVEMADRILPPADKDLVQPLFLKLKKLYTILTRAKVTGISTEDEAVTVGVEQAGEDKTGEYDAVLVAVGRRPNSGRIGLENIGLSTDTNGFIQVDQRQRTQIDNIFAVGDLVGEPMLAHKATHQGKVAAEVCAGRAAAFDAMGIPSVAYTIPEVAWVGLTETAAKENNIEYEKGKFPWGASSRALSADAAIGTTKVLFSKETGRLVGAGICGINSGELIQEAVLALEMGANARDIARTIHAHPTLSETFAFASEMVDGSITDAMPPGKKR
jgi:dihydrolipoamide dehydrogenase